MLKTYKFVFKNGPAVAWSNEAELPGKTILVDIG